MTKPDQPTGSLCGVWVDGQGQVHTTRSTPTGGREMRLATFRPFAWLNDTPAEETYNAIHLERLAGDSPFNRLVHADDFEIYDTFLRETRETVGVDAIRPLESQYLLQHRERLYRDLAFHQLRRCQLDIETRSSDDGFCDPARPEDRVLAIGLRCGGRDRLLVLEEQTDAAERSLLESLNAALAELDPDVIEGHNIFKFDFD
jgi:DNA polymerase elongation subunit (family B)